MKAMMKRFLASLLCLIMLCASGLELACAEDASEKAQALIDGIITYHLERTGSADVQAWIDGELAQNAGAGSEWYVFALSRMGEYDFSAYRERLLRYIEGAGVLSASTRQKYALVLICTGSDDPFIQTVVDDSIGQQGLMSWVYGLHLLHNGYEGAVTSQEAVEQLLSMQLADGGWANSGTVSDVDVTSMTLQALAPHAGEAAVGESIERALTMLGQRQLPDGDYVSYGVSNPESGAQVLVALSALGVNALEDERFIKNGHTVLDGISRYQLADGSFSHTLGGATNANATVQALYAMVAWQRMMDGHDSIYLIDQRPAAEKTAQPQMKMALGYKPIAVIVIAALALVICVILLIMKKRSAKNYIAVLGIAAALTAFVLTTDFQTADSYYTGQTIVKHNPIGKVTMSIRCDTALGKTELQLPPDGVMLAETTFDIVEGDTAFDILTEAAQTYGIRLDSSGPQGMVYLSGINHLYEFACGELSGWIYFVNGESASTGCDQHVLRDGDVIEWRYTCEMGNDLK